MTEPRLAAHIRIEVLKRATQAAGGFATLLAKGDPVSGAILIVRTFRSTQTVVMEGFTGLQGTLEWQEIWQDTADVIARKGSLTDYIARRRSQDRDIWVIELDVANRAQFDVIIDQAR